MVYSEADKLNIWMSIAFEGAARTGKLAAEYNGGINELHSAVLNGNAELGKIGPARRSFIRTSASSAYIDDFIAELEKNSIVAVTISDPAYPVLLREIDDPPFVLYERGAAAGQPIESPFAVVGTRHCSDYGRKVALMMGEALASCGVTVISGLAYGCDSYAHEGALAANAPFPTAAILGSGVLIDKKDSTQRTMDSILERGMVISEYLPKSLPVKGSFPMRNRIISGISNGVLVVEAGQKSGTMITVDFALDQGRNVFAVPGRITDTLNSGTNEMLRAGMAQPVYSVEDLLDQLGLSGKAVLKSGSVSDIILDVNQKMIYELLEQGEKSFDELLEKTALDLENLSLHLTDLEFSGLIKQLPGRVYTVN